MVATLRDTLDGVETAPSQQFYSVPVETKGWGAASLGRPVPTGILPVFAPAFGLPVVVALRTSRPSPDRAPPLTVRPSPVPGVRLLAGILPLSTIRPRSGVSSPTVLFDL